MKKPILLILAAGMGSRYGGLKQIDPLGPNGEIIIDYSLHDARKAGFERVVFIIKKENEADFERVIGAKAREFFEVNYAFQELSNLPSGYSLPEGRVKPWGTAHALLAAAPFIDAPFVIFNADDFYGAEAFRKIYQFLINYQPQKPAKYAMVGYEIENTLSTNGHVTRGVCELGKNNEITNVVERMQIIKKGDFAYYEEGGEWIQIPAKTPVSMNFWGFGPEVISLIEAEFKPFLAENIEKNPLKSEYLLPTVIGNAILAGKLEIDLLRSQDRWYGVTYQEDKPLVTAALKQMLEQKIYPANLWE